jgi:DNA-binding transcriptional LysR family regulator
MDDLMSLHRPERLVWDLDWNLLRSFVVIAEVKSITRAAERLNLKQPSVSNALRRLEDRIGQRLVERDATHFELTDVGKLVRGVGDNVTGHVTISVASHIISPIFDQALALFHEQHPNATLTINVSASTEVARLVREKRASFGLGLVSNRDPALDYTMVYREFFGFFCGPRHRMFGQSGLTLADLKGEPSVSFQTDHIADALRPVALLRSEARLSPDVVGTSSSLEEVRRMIITGLGIGPLPLHVARREIDDGLLWRLPPYDNPPAIDVFLIHNPEANLNKAEKAMLAGLKSIIGSTPLEERIYQD